MKSCQRPFIELISDKHHSYYTTYADKHQICTRERKTLIKLDNYLVGDHEAAMKENFCIETCLTRAQFNAAKGNFNEAREALIDAMKSVNEMGKLQQKKRYQDKLAEMTYMATQNKVPLQILVIKQK